MNSNLTFATGRFLHRTRLILVNDPPKGGRALRIVRQDYREELRP
jgi:hypothetical protein